MKRILLGLVIGVVIGAAVSWALLHARTPEPAEAQSAEPVPQEAGLHLTKEQQAVAGLVIANPEPAELGNEIKAFGRVLDATPLATLLAEIETADSEAAASAKEWERLKSLGENAAVRALETAEAAMKRDRAAAASAHGRLLGNWGKALSDRADLGSLTRRLLAQEIALARADLPAGKALSRSPAGVRVAPVTRETAFQAAEIIGFAPDTDPQAQSQGFLMLIPDRPPAPGTALTVLLTNGGATERGFLLPRSAVVQRESGMFVYVQKSEEQFELKPVQIGPQQPEGIFVESGIGPNDRIVTTGAQQLLSEELKAAGGGE